MKIVLASHSNLAQGMKDTAEFIMGKQENLSAITAYVDEKVDFSAQLTALISEMAEEPIIFISDLLGGSVNRVITETIAGKREPISNCRDEFAIGIRNCFNEFFCRTSKRLRNNSSK